MDWSVDARLRRLEEAVRELNPGLNLPSPPRAEFSIPGTSLVYRLDEGDRWASTSEGKVVIAKADGAVLILSPPEYAPKRLALMTAQ